MERFERPRLPVVITGLCDSWRASREWTQDTLLQRYGEHKFKVWAPSLNLASNPGSYPDDEHCSRSSDVLLMVPTHSIKNSAGNMWVPLSKSRCRLCGRRCILTPRTGPGCVFQTSTKLSVKSMSDKCKYSFSSPTTLQALLGTQEWRSLAASVTSFYVCIYRLCKIVESCRWERMMRAMQCE